MESLYYVMAWACHRKCRHCYEDRFRPYVRDALEAVVKEAEVNFPRIIDHLPERHTFRERRGDAVIEHGGRIVLSGGECLLDPVRQRVTYKVIEALQRRYAGQGVKIVVQTTGDLLTAPIVRDLLARGIWMISIAGVDDFHVGMEGEARQRAYVETLSALLDAEGLRRSQTAVVDMQWFEQEGPLYSFFGATPDQWIGRLWPRGRGWANSLSTATLADNFCARWSGGLGFLHHRDEGSEVSIEPDGSVYPCCVKTGLPIGNLLDTPLLDILEARAGDPVYQAIDRGMPQQMGLTHGWSEDEFLRRSETTTPDGRPYANLCIGCDRFHAEVLAPLRDPLRTGAAP